MKISRYEFSRFTGPATVDVVHIKLVENSINLVGVEIDQFGLPPEDVEDAVVNVTVFDGKVVYTRSSDSSET